MDCPYNIPLKAKYGKLSDSWLVENAKGIVLFFDLSEERAKYLVQAINSHEKKLVRLLRDSTNILTGLMQEHQVVDTDCPTTFSHYTLQKLTRQRKANKQALKEAEKQ